jgi:hypothetical protein
MLGDEMNFINKKNNRYVTAASIGISVHDSPHWYINYWRYPTRAATTRNMTTSSSEIELSSQPIYQDQVRQLSEIPINQTHILSNVAGDGTLTLANTTEPIRTTSSRNLIVSLKGTAPTAAEEQIVRQKMEARVQLHII